MRSRARRRSRASRALENDAKETNATCGDPRTPRWRERNVNVGGLLCAVLNCVHSLFSIVNSFLQHMNNDTPSRTTITGNCYFDHFRSMSSWRRDDGCGGSGREIRFGRGTDADVGINVSAADNLASVGTHGSSDGDEILAATAVAASSNDLLSLALGASQLLIDAHREGVFCAVGVDDVHSHAKQDNVTTIATATGRIRIAEPTIHLHGKKIVKFLSTAVGWSCTATASETTVTVAVCRYSVCRRNGNKRRRVARM